MKRFPSIVVGVSIAVITAWGEWAAGCAMLAGSFDQPVDFTQLIAQFTILPAKGGLRDGWGVAYYPDSSVAIFKEPNSATESALLKLLLEQRMVQAKLFTLHLRAASKRAPVSPRNTHPWVRELDRREYVLSLVGAADERLFQHFRPKHFQPLGENSGELMLCQVLSEIKDRRITAWNEEHFAWLHGVLKNINAYHQATTLFIADGTHLFAYASVRGAGISYCQREMPVAKVVGKGGPLRSDSAPSARGYLLCVGGVAAIAQPGEHWQPLGGGQLAVFKDGKLLYLAKAEKKEAPP